MNGLNITNEDCMDLMKRYPDQYFDLAIVDTPYFDGPNKLGYYGQRMSKTGVTRKPYKRLGKWDLPDAEYFRELRRVSKHQIIWGCNYYEQHIQGPGRLVWNKLNTETTFNHVEIASVSLNDRQDIVHYMWSGMMQGLVCSTDIRKAMVQQGNKSKNEKRIHPTQKPIKLYAWMLNKYAKTGDKILDTHLGSGSHAIACWELGFELTACEADQQIFEDAMNRINEHARQPLLFHHA